MAQDLSNFDQAEYGDVPFTPHVPRRRAIVEDDDGHDYLLRDPNPYPKAIAGGLLGAALGAIVYAVFVCLTGWTIGYLAILVGYLVGKGIMIGSRDEGGEQYQFIAVAFTYLSVAAARSAVLWWVAERYRPVTFDSQAFFKLLSAGLSYPVAELMASPVSGVIGLVILFVGMRAAWRMTSATPGTRSPFAR